MGKFQKPKEKKSTEQKKQTRKYFRLTITGILVVLLAVMPMLASRNAEGDASQASILSATVENKNIDTQIIGGGQLSSEASLNIRIPENVKLTQYLVGNGDTVKEGEPIAKVDKVSVMTAITEVQETLDYLAEEIAAASGDTASTSVKALAGGTVKVIYARGGESVQDVMLDHGALAILSLDDTMAVKIERQTTLDVGDTVCVTLAEGTKVDGRVKTNLEGVLTVTLDDDDYSVGAKVTVSTESGEELGTGELYVFSPWSATAYSGTISDVQVAENDTVAIGRVLFTLEDTGNSAQFQRLIDQRQEYEELMQELFTMYRTETITAPCDGIVTGVDEDGAYLLADAGDGWFVNLLSFFGPEKDGFVAYAVTVTEVTASGTELRVDPKAMYIEDLAAASGLYVDVNDTTESWNYPGEIAVYTQDENGLLHSSGSAKAGDILLAIGDEEQVCWFVKLDGSNEPAQATQTENKSGRIELSLLSNEGTGDQGGDDQGGDDQADGYQGGDDQGSGDQSGGDQGGGDQDGDDQGGGDQVGGNQGDGEQGGDDQGDGDQGGGDQGGDDQGGGDQDGGDQGDSNQGGDDQDDDDQTAEFTIFTGYVAQVMEIRDGWAKVKQTLYSYAITDLLNIPKVFVSATDLIVEKEYTSDLIDTSALTVGNTVLIVVDNEGTVRLVSKDAIQESQGAPGQQTGTNTGGTPSGGMSADGGMTGGMAGGMGQVQTFEPYSLEKLTVASVTSQEHMTVSITIDELDITKIYVGQAAVVSVDALGGEQFDAEITKVSNSGENEGGNSKFTVEVTLGKSGEMLPGMYSSAFITLETCENVPCVPVAALGKDGVDSILYTSYDAETGTLGDPVVVSIGVSDGENVQILEGFATGETCYYEYFDTYVGSDSPQQQGGGFNLGAMMGRR